MKPAIIGISGTVLTGEEHALLRGWQPLGVILFGRNICDPEQLAALVAEIRDALPDGLLMVDQEGGRVARLRPPFWPAFPPARALQTEAQALDQGRRIGELCRAAGFDLVAAPVLDVGDPDGHDVIGDRAFSADPAHVAAMGAAMARGLLRAGIQPIGKHAPGHGRARADSHLTLPVLDDVLPSDLAPFIANRTLPWLMTAHIRYNARDMIHPATQSAAIIEGIIRSPGGIGFRGVLITDDLAMQALTGTPGERAARALAAGCDVALHCSGLAADSRDVLRTIPEVTLACHERLYAARRMAAIGDPSTQWLTHGRVLYDDATAPRP
jgi:beta-N-acetylhexosaminidase